MSDARQAGVVVDTMVMSWIMEPVRSPLSGPYEELIGPRPIAVAFQTVMELRFGALNANWGELRRRKLDRELTKYSLLQPDDDTATVCAELRHRCVRFGHALGDKIHDGDRWIAATAIRLRVPLASHDGVFSGTPRLELLTLRALT
jgi:predicted nucleic acid-binding protein